MTRPGCALAFCALARLAGAAPPPVLICRGHEPVWSLQLQGSSGTLAKAGGAPVRLEGELREASGGSSPSFVFRGKAAPAEDLVATITTEACAGSGSDGALTYTARVSLASGELLLGCCTAASPDAATASASPTPAPAAANPLSHAVPAAASLAGEIAELALPGGQVCRSTGKGATKAFGGQRVNFDCGVTSGDRVVLLGALAAGSDGLLTGQKALIEWSGNAPRKVEATPARVTVVRLADGLTCRSAGASVALSFEGRRASYACGIQDGDTIALLGELEPTDAGFRVVRARLVQGESAFTLRSSETILVAAPR